MTNPILTGSGIVPPGDTLRLWTNLELGKAVCISADPLTRPESGYPRLYASGWIRGVDQKRYKFHNLFGLGAVHEWKSNGLLVRAEVNQRGQVRVRSEWRSPEEDTPLVSRGWRSPTELSEKDLNHIGYHSALSPYPPGYWDPQPESCGAHQWEYKETDTNGFYRFTCQKCGREGIETEDERLYRW